MSFSEFFPADLFDYRLAIALGVAVAGGLMRGFAGFGSAMMLSPVYAILYGPVEMIVILTLMELGIGLQLVPSAWKDAQWNFIGPLSTASVLCMPIGMLILVNADQDLLTRAIAGIVLVFVLIMFAGWRYHGPKRLPITMGLGAVSGTMMATTSIGGPPVLIYMLSGPDKAATNRANIIMYFAITELFLLAIITWNGLISLDAIYRAALLTPLYLLAGYLGARSFRQSSETLYRRIALTILTLIALFGLFRGL